MVLYLLSQRKKALSRRNGQQCQMVRGGWEQFQYKGESKPDYKDLRNE